MVFRSPPNSNDLAVSISRAGTNPPLSPDPSFSLRHHRHFFHTATFLRDRSMGVLGWLHPLGSQNYRPGLLVVTKYVSGHAQTNTLLIFVAIAHATSMRHRCRPSSSTPLRLSSRRFIYNLVYLVCDYRLDTHPLGWFPGRWTHSIR